MLLVYGEEKNRAFPPEPVAALLDVLQDVVKYGTGTQARLADRPVAGKTGTADEGKDIWFIGFTPDLVTAIWGGNDENLPIPGHNITGGVVMAKIWRAYNEAYYKACPTAPGAFPLCDYKLALKNLQAKNEQTDGNADKVAQSKGKLDIPGSIESILDQPKVEEIKTTNESPTVELNDNTQAPIQPSSMPLPAPARAAPKIESLVPEAATPAPPASQSAVSSTPSPAPQRLIPAKITNSDHIEPGNSASSTRRLYPYQQ